MKQIKALDQPEGVALLHRLPDGVKDRLLAQTLLALTIRQRLSFEQAPLHGLIPLMGSGHRKDHAWPGPRLARALLKFGRGVHLAADPAPRGSDQQRANPQTENPDA